VRVIIQRVTEARVSVGGETVGKIGRGLCVFLGVGKTDDEGHADALAVKLCNLRIFEDDQGKMNRSIIDVQGEILVVSQFTLYGDCTRGNRPSFTEAASPVEAERLYSYFVQKLQNGGLTVTTGRFQARMNVSLTNDGPVTFFVEA
jgi:D-tyrosyl-tRNA(Tyr) deacylase